MKAWRVVWKRMPDEVSICIAGKRSEALHLVPAAIKDAGWCATWCELRATRAAEYDGWAGRQPEGRRRVCWSEEYVRQPISAPE